MCGWNDYRSSHKMKNCVICPTYVPAVRGLYLYFCIQLSLSKKVIWQNILPNRSVLARVWSEVLWEKRQCSLRILVPFLLWRPPCIPCFPLRTNFKVAEAASHSPSAWEGENVFLIPSPLDSEENHLLASTVPSDLTCPPKINNLSAKKSVAWKWERSLIFSLN